jgi:hypothetical protein
MQVSGELHVNGKDTIFFPGRHVGHRTGLDAVEII